MRWFWYFTCYSFLGFLLEVLFARAVGGRPDRKRLLLLPLCPVYGLGACACLAAAPLARGNPVRLALLGALACTAVEYAAAVWYERGLGVRFWDYSGKPGNLHGRVCLPFSAAWGVLCLVMVYGVQPHIAAFAAGTPFATSAACLFAVGFDLTVSGVLLRRTRDRACLRWYDGFFRHRRAPDREAV